MKSIIESARIAKLTPVVVGATLHLAELHAQLKQYDKALGLFEQLLGPKPYAKPNDLADALIEGQLAHVLMQQHKDERAEALFQSALSTLATSSMNTTISYAFMCTRYGKLKARQKDWQNAVDYLERGLKIESDAIPQSGALVDTLEVTAQVYGKLGRRDDAKNCRNRAKALRGVLDKPGQPNTVDVAALAAEMR